jgi:type II secretory pathway predicted ATPase ExeA
MDFLSYYGMSFNPFSKEINSNDLYETVDIKNVNSRLKFLLECKGLGVFTADSGVGKTSAMRGFCEKLNKSLYKVVYISISTLTTLEFYKALAYELGIIPKVRKIDIFRQIQDEIKRIYKEQKITPIIIIDEAQYLRTDIINDLKILLNFDMDSKNYMLLILIGTNTLINILNRNIHDAVKQRININYTFTGIDNQEIKEYIKSRLLLAGSNEHLFEENAINTLANSCNGSIRNLNNLITKSLIIGCKLNKSNITTDIINDSYEEINM